jgi:hypothetical protein
MQPQQLITTHARSIPALARIRVGRRAEHLCVEAGESIARGEVILSLVGRRVRRPDRYSIQIGPRTHLTPPSDLAPDLSVAEYGWRFLNHSCEPNAYIRGLELMALEDVPEGGEITFDYNTTEWDMAVPFACLCGTPSCVGAVRGYRHLDEARRAHLLPWLAEHLRVRV